MLEFQPCDARGAKKARMEQRLSPEAKSLIEQAARLQGVDISEFVVAHVVTAARQTIAKLEATTLRVEDVQAFMHAFEDDQPNEALTELFARHAEIMTTDDHR